ncbi:MAG: type II toxin-antitoxin system PemK/MazF family toxin [Elusimicrobia bacterium]|nr:type II toxin-antitoxin system PemK/MazF family toxin [Elusimicrobiota bacterium]
MRRGEVWWAHLPPPAGRRPVLLLSRDRAIQVREAVTVAQVTRTVRDIPTEVPLAHEDGMPKPCVVNTDVLLTIPKALIEERICGLSAEKMSAVNRAAKFALGLD